jgi:tRNA uridine 5-carboxymethylaminomethyl modification enzyme
MHCYSVHTTAATHEVIRANLHRAPMFNGVIEGVGPRYCPSIEDKIVRFAEKGSHHLFLEPEGWETDWVYLQGANTSLPEDAQEALVHSIPGLEQAEILRYGYAVEYDFVRTHQTRVTLESRLHAGLFFAGQVNGTSGYEEAAAQGLIAGINAAHHVLGRPPLVLRRDQAYIGVMLDDLVSRDLTEPYRMFTSRCEYRLLLRHDNADIRLTPLAVELGLLPAGRGQAVARKAEAVGQERGRLERTYVAAGSFPGLRERKTLAAILRRPEVGYAGLLAAGLGNAALAADVREQVEVQVKYSRYIEQHQAELARVRRQEDRRLPAAMDYTGMTPLRKEARLALDRFRPETLGQASRLEGVTPADVNVLLVDLERRSTRRELSGAR